MSDNKDLLFLKWGTFKGCDLNTAAAISALRNMR
jgi:hypothetical protein